MRKRGEGKLMRKRGRGETHEEKGGEIHEEKGERGNS